MKKSVKKKSAKPTYLREIQIRFKKKRLKDGSPVGKPMTDSKRVYELFKDMQNEAKEKLIAVALDSQLKIICFEVVCIGSVDSIFVRPYEVIWGILSLRPYGVIVVHNHTSGNPRPSPSDKKFTKCYRLNSDRIGSQIKHV